MTILKKIIYTPPEDHLGVIFSRAFGREKFSQLVPVGKYVVLYPFRYVYKEILLSPRTAFISLDDVITEDYIPLELEMKVFYRVDPRDADKEKFLQVIDLSPEAIDTIIKVNIEEITRNDIFIHKIINHLFSSEGRQEVRRELSTGLAERVRGFGITVNPLYGVAIISLQPNEIYLKDLHDQSAAKALSEAAIQRVYPMLEQLSQNDIQSALQAVFQQLAQAINLTDSLAILPGDSTTDAPPPPEEDIKKALLNIHLKKLKTT